MASKHISTIGRVVGKKVFSAFNWGPTHNISVYFIFDSCVVPIVLRVGPRMLM